MSTREKVKERVGYCWCVGWLHKLLLLCSVTTYYSHVLVFTQETKEDTRLFFHFKSAYPFTQKKRLLLISHQPRFNHISPQLQIDEVYLMMFVFLCFILKGNEIFSRELITSPSQENQRQIRKRVY